MRLRHELLCLLCDLYKKMISMIPKRGEVGRKVGASNFDSKNSANQGSHTFKMRLGRAAAAIAEEGVLQRAKVARGEVQVRLGASKFFIGSKKKVKPHEKSPPAFLADFAGVADQKKNLLVRRRQFSGHFSLS